MTVTSYFLSAVAFWIAWVAIPLVMEILPAMFSFCILLKKKYIKKKYEPILFYPEITLIIPVYNSEDCLENCIRSVHESDYENQLIHILVINNESKDDSFDIFKKCQQEFEDLNMTWFNAKQGKSKALNYGLFNSHGKYIIHIDSDGRLHPDAIKNIVTLFEHNEKADCVTGTILTHPEEIDCTKNVLLRLFRKLEFFEYCQAFLAGRNFESEFNSIYTVSGAFSAFRKSTILKTELYNTDTICEDTHITFQVRQTMKKKVMLCDNAFFFVDPIPSVNKMYTQRQRWQRGEMEVSHIFYKRKSNGGLSGTVINLLMFDHTFAFPRMIWYFALMYLGFMNFSFRLILISVTLMYGLYMFSNFLYYIVICIYLKKHNEIRNYYRKKWYLIIIFPLYNFLIFWFRFAGIVNSIKTEQTWKTKDLTDEITTCQEITAKDFGWILNPLKELQEFVNEKENEEE